MPSSAEGHVVMGTPRRSAVRIIDEQEPPKVAPESKTV